MTSLNVSKNLSEYEEQSVPALRYPTAVFWLPSCNPVASSATPGQTEDGTKDISALLFFF